MAQNKAIEVQRPNLAKDQTKPTKAYVDVKYHGIMLKGIRVMEGKTGFFLSMASQKRMRDGKPVLVPNEKTGQNEEVWDDHYFPASEEVRNELTAAVLAAYNAKVESEKALANSKPPQA